MNAPMKEIEVDLRAIGCPYRAEDPRTAVWIDGYFKGEAVGIEKGAKAVSDVVDRHFERMAAR